ncbi:F-box associated domain type 1 [Arabidopsis suecica]|uniref:F-box associated domain type 1 n=1 Tax=Arabidopsis suecica TaxID=45249 RepID=A0A8T2BAP4_ARASU|nr:F-box associated domain type 1 [Arabidopsis suecica]
MTDSTTAISDLPRDMVEEVLSRVPLTSLRSVRTTCKNWNSLFKTRSFTKKHIRKSRAATKKREFMAITMIDSSIYLMSVNLRGIHNNNNVESFINRKAKFISLNNVDGVDISSVFHCSGLLLCTTKEENSRLVVLNPYRGQTRWIQPIDHGGDCRRRDMYTLGYEKKENSRRRYHKILRSMVTMSRSVDDYGICDERHRVYQIYNFKSDSWKDIDATPNRDMRFYGRDVSLKGNTYWLVRMDTNWFRGQEIFEGQERFVRFIERVRDSPDFFLLCFDFTTERFGPRIRLPFRSSIGDRVALSSVREKHLAVLRQQYDTLRMEIWISSKIEPGEVSWSKLFVTKNMTTLLTFPFEHGNFFVDVRKKVVVAFAKDKETPKRWVACVIGEDGYLKKVDLGESTDKHGFLVQLVCPYVPSSVKIK